MSGFVGAHLYLPGEPVRSFPAAFRLEGGLDNGDPDLAARQALETSIRGTAVPFVRRAASIDSDASGGGAGAATTGTVPAQSPTRVPAGSPSRAVRMVQGSLL